MRSHSLRSQTVAAEVTRLKSPYKALSNLDQSLVTSAATILILAFGLCISAHAAQPGSASLRQRTLMDADWRFHRGEVTSSNEVLSASYDGEGSWERVQLPHDYQLDSKYEPPDPLPEPGGSGRVSDARRRGYLPVEVAWYRKHFSIPESDKGKILQLEFGGISATARSG